MSAHEEDDDLIVMPIKKKQSKSDERNPNAGGYLYISDGLWEVYKSGQFSDMTITCGGETFNVHKVIVSAQSKVFAAMMGWPGKFKEGQTNHIDLPEKPLPIVRAIVQFLYTGDYNEPEEKQLGYGPPKFHAEVYAAAEKYDIARLATEAEAWYRGALRHLKDPECQIRQVHAFFESIPAVYELTSDSNRNLREAAVLLMTTRGYDIDELDQGSGELKNARTKAFLENPAFAADVYEHMLKEGRLICRGCSDKNDFMTCGVKCTECKEYKLLRRID